MNAVEFLAHFVNILVACSALPAYETRLDGQNYQVQMWTCRVDQGPITVRAWRRECDTGRVKYWGRINYVNFDELQTAAYINKFGEVYIGQGAQLSEAYATPCGS